MNGETGTAERTRSRDGQTMTEYALILATIAAVVIALYQTTGTIVQSLLTIQSIVICSERLNCTRGEAQHLEGRPCEDETPPRVVFSFEPIEPPLAPNSTFDGTV